MSRPARLNYFSFLDLMCCALGGALLVLVIVSADRRPTGSRKTVTVTVETLFETATVPVRVTANPLPGHDVNASTVGKPLWDRQVPVTSTEKGLFVAAAPGTQDRAFRVLVTVPKRAARF